MSIENTLIGLIFILAIAYITQRAIKSIGAKGCEKGCAGACSKVEIKNN